MSIAAIGLSDVPVEILDRILDFLHDDAAALFSASLVSHDWVSAPRHHMFHRTVLKEVDVPFPDKSAIQENVASFLALSQSEHCTVLPAIQCVVICIPTPELVEQVVKVLERAEGLSQMVFMQCDESELPVISWASTHTLSNIHDFTFNAMPALGDDGWRLITSFPSLHTLAVYMEADATIILPRDLSGSSFRSIRNLHLRLAQSEELFDWLNNLEGSPLTRVETLDLRICRNSHKGWGPVKALNSLLKANSEMKYLSIGVHYRCSSSAFLLDEDINLSPLTNLRSLFLRVHDMNSICNSISSLNPSSSLDFLTVHTLIPWGPNAYTHPRRRQCHCDYIKLFTRLSGILDSQKFVGTRLDLQVLDLEIEDVPDLGDLENLFIGWKQRGALKVSHTDDDDDMQRNTYGELRNLLWEHPLDKITQPVFLR